ncbi:hypothetical protein LUZ63_000272 [Rhynchospora breviuscula]|uniref:Uncharacterized protein n=1 Tax=Rhynchospora breviuscula TaxID=2022672 RepID=A0A9Q0CUL5_9POAL|nr:hypothetical protein LUZ63_000272 [Rhynchospora breviuscula]
MGEPSYANIRDQVDDFYISALSNGDKRHDLIPISDENYAMELQLQEVLFSSVTVSPKPVKIAREDRACSSSSQAGQLFCKICMETVPGSDLFKTSKACSHVFCRDCLSCYLGTEIQENILGVRCPEENCKAVLEPGMCQQLLPSEVFKRWESALCESMVLGAQKIHCPFKDCSALMVHDADETVTRSECPSCRRWLRRRTGGGAQVASILLRRKTVACTSHADVVLSFAMDVGKSGALLTFAAALESHFGTSYWLYNTTNSASFCNGRMMDYNASLYNMTHFGI